ncbi:MAG: RHS repeat domain-containing protein, partial [Burkholderiales bacterium]
WGKRRNTNGQDNNNIAAWVGLSSKTDRGYTGHEHIDDIGLIHMNGRLYDPITGRMMSADPIIQAPYLLQNYNRYSYVMNNPLSLTDPSGFSWWTRWRKPILAIAVAWAIGPAGFWSQTGGIMGNAFASTMAAGFAAGGIMGGNIESAIQGAFSAALFYGVGELSGAHEAAAAGRSMTGAEHLAQTLGHAAVGCAQSSVAGGSCGQGALSAGFAAAAGPMLPGAEISAARFVSRMIVGGVASRLGGGSFESGATSAAFAYLFNDVGGKMMEGRAAHAAITKYLQTQFEGEGYLIQSEVRTYWPWKEGYGAMDIQVTMPGPDSQTKHIFEIKPFSQSAEVNPSAY